MTQITSHTQVHQKQYTTKGAVMKMDIGYLQEVAEKLLTVMKNDDSLYDKDWIDINIDKGGGVTIAISKNGYMTRSTRYTEGSEYEEYNKMF